MIDAIIGGVATLGSALIGANASSSANSSAIERQRLANQGNIELADRNNNFNLEMWNKNNEYNSPAAQIQRYKDAGLNPALIYGSSGNSGNSSSPVHGTAARIDALPARDLTGVSQYLTQGLNNLIDMANKIEDIKSKKIGNSILAYKEKYSDRLLQAGLDQVLLGNQFKNDSMQSRLDYEFWKANHMTSTAVEKQNYVNEWQSKFLARQLEHINSDIALKKSSKGKIDRFNARWDKDIPLFDRERQYQLNNIDFADNNIWRGIDKGMDILGGLIDMFSGIGRGLSFFKKAPKIRSTFRIGGKDYTQTDYKYTDDE